MPNDQDGAPRPAGFGDARPALAAEPLVSNRQNFIEEQELGLEVNGDREGESKVHSGRVVFKRSVQEVAERTLRVLKHTIPAALPGIVFLSGGQSDMAATAHLDAMNRIGAPWPLTFSYSRALQNAALKTWAGKAASKRPSASQTIRHMACTYPNRRKAASATPNRDPLTASRP